jgi:hypothetical protein
VSDPFLVLHSFLTKAFITLCPPTSQQCSSQLSPHITAACSFSNRYLFMPFPCLRYSDVSSLSPGEAQSSELGLKFAKATYHSMKHMLQPHRNVVPRKPLFYCMPHCLHTSFPSVSKSSFFSHLNL